MKENLLIKSGDVYFVAAALRMGTEPSTADVELAIKHKRDEIFKLLYKLCEEYGIQQNKNCLFGGT